MMKQYLTPGLILISGFIAAMFLETVSVSAAPPGLRVCNTVSMKGSSRDGHTAACNLASSKINARIAGQPGACTRGAEIGRGLDSRALPASPRKGHPVPEYWYLCTLTVEYCCVLRGPAGRR